MPATSRPTFERIRRTEFSDQFEGWVKGALQQGLIEPKSRRMTVEEMMELEPPKWLLQHFIPEQGLVMAFGPPKTGKTFMGLDWGYSIAVGRPWFTFETRPGKVLYLPAEGVATMGERLKALKQKRGYPDTSRFQFLPGMTELFHDPEKIPPASILEVLRDIIEWEPDLVVFDTLLRHTTRGDVSSNRDMQQVADFLTKTIQGFGIAVLLIHHPRRMDAQWLGATSLFGAVDSLVKLQPVTKEEDEKRMRMTVITKEYEDLVLPWVFKVKAVDHERAGWATFEPVEVMVPGDSSLWTRALALLHPTPQHWTVIHEELYDTEPSAATGYKLLRRMEESGFVSQQVSGGKGTGVFELLPRGITTIELLLSEEI